MPNPNDSLYVDPYMMAALNSPNPTQQQYMMAMMQQIMQLQQMQNQMSNPSFKGVSDASQSVPQNFQVDVNSANASNNILNQSGAVPPAKSGGGFKKVLGAAAVVGAVVLAVKSHKKVTLGEAENFMDGAKKTLKSLKFWEKSAEKAEKSASDSISSSKTLEAHVLKDGTLFYRVPGKKQTIKGTQAEITAKAKKLGIEIPAEVPEHALCDIKGCEGKVQVVTSGGTSTDYVVKLVNGRVMKVTQGDKDVTSLYKSTASEHEALREAVNTFVKNIEKKDKSTLDSLENVTKIYSKDNVNYLYIDDKLHSLRTDRFGREHWRVDAWIGKHEGSREWAEKVGDSSKRNKLTSSTDRWIYEGDGGIKILVENGEIKGVYHKITANVNGQQKVSETLLKPENDMFSAYKERYPEDFKAALNKKTQKKSPDDFMLRVYKFNG